MNLVPKCQGSEPGDSGPPTSRSPVAKRAGDDDPLGQAEEHVNALFLAALSGGPRAEREILDEVALALHEVLMQSRHLPEALRDELCRAETMAATAVEILDRIQDSSAELVRKIVCRR